MGDIILVILTVAYVAACVFFWLDRRREPQQLTEAYFAEFEQMINNYYSESN